VPNAPTVAHRAESSHAHIVEPAPRSAVSGRRNGTTGRIDRISKVDLVNSNCHPGDKNLPEASQVRPRRRPDT
jgi:hypothetical protein